jgi:hypothetical protein
MPLFKDTGLETASEKDLVCCFLIGMMSNWQRQIQFAPADFKPSNAKMRN